jgi:hypothetical protein
VYVPGAVEPMLPEALSNAACSLVPGEDRLAVTVEMDLSGARVERARFHRSTIRSDAPAPPRPPSTRRGMRAARSSSTPPSPSSSSTAAVTCTGG